MKKLFYSSPILRQNGFNIAENKELRQLNVMLGLFMQKHVADALVTQCLCHTLKYCLVFFNYYDMSASGENCVSLFYIWIQQCDFTDIFKPKYLRKGLKQNERISQLSLALCILQSSVCLYGLYFC